MVPQGERPSSALHDDQRSRRECPSLERRILPKIEDDNWCQTHRDQLEELFEDANIVGDGHWTWASNNLIQAHIYAPLSDDMAITKQAKKNNIELRKVRGSVEGIFGWMKEHFQQLARSWQEGEEQQRCMVYLLAAVYTYQVGV